jgi:protease-4
LQIQVTRVGKYKSAVESFLYSEMTPENEEQLRGILGSFQDEFFEVSSSREGCGEALAEIMATRGMVGTEDALAAGLIDKVQYWDQILDSLAEMSGEEEDGTFRQISMQEYAQPQSPSATNASIAVVFAQGVIVDGESSGGIGGDSLAYQLRQLRYTEEIKAVVLRVNSPGGSASASEVILREMELLKEDGKLVIVSMGNVAASGGYWIACKADAIVAERTTITGSIGVFGIFPNFAEAASRLGLHEEVVKTGPFADLESMWRPKSDLELQVIQSFVDGIYDGFLERVSDGRGMERDAVHEIAQGRVWSGEAALDRGLVDQLGGLQDAIALAKEKLGDADASVMYDLPELDPLDEILAQILEELPAPLASLKALPLDEVQLWLAPFQSQKGWQCWARLPFLINLR